MVTMIGYLSVAVLMVVTAPGQVVETRALIEQALNEPARITLDDVKLGDAIRIVTEQTGVKIVMPPDVMDLVPLGASTPVEHVDIANMPLREALAALFSPLGMTCRVRDTYVEVVPRESLRRLGRAPTWDELETLTTLESMEPGLDAQARAKLVSRIQLQVPIPNARATLTQVLTDVGAGPGDEVLTVACRNLGWSWTLSGDKIVILGKAEQIRRQLRRPISLRKNNRPLFEVLQAVGREVGVTVRAEPGALQTLPVSVQRNFSVNVQQQSAEQVLDSIAAYTGLGYVTTPEGVVFFQSDNTPAGVPPVAAASPDAAHVPPTGVPTQGTATDPYVAKMTIMLEDGKTAEWLIRRSELPEDLRRMRQRDLADLFAAVRRKAASREP